MAKKWYGILHTEGIAEHVTVISEDISFHITDQANAFSTRNSPLFTAKFKASSGENSSQIEISYELILSKQPEYYLTYERELYLEYLTLNDYLVKEGHRRRRIFWNYFVPELIIFFLPSLQLKRE